MLWQLVQWMRIESGPFEGEGSKVLEVAYQIFRKFVFFIVCFSVPAAQYCKLSLCQTLCPSKKGKLLREWPELSLDGEK